mgnify:CR=1 FL=1
MLTTDWVDNYPGFPDGVSGFDLMDKMTAHAKRFDVNIMTKLDRDRMSRGKVLPPVFSDAMSALRGYANSRLRSSLVLSAGMNRRLFGYLAEFPDFFPDAEGGIRKRIILKVGDFRSALIQGKLLARKGLWVSEYRIESGLNCGGHAFGGKGTLLGPVLSEFATKRDELKDQLHEVWVTGLAEMGRTAPPGVMDIRVTVQGGIGTAEDHNIHHLLFKFNYGHFFMWWDWALGTYRAPHTIKKFRSFYEFQEALLKEHGDGAVDLYLVSAATGDDEGAEGGADSLFVNDGKAEKYFIRTGPSTTELTASQQHEHISQRFPK